jgi:hypothetical protein
MLGTSMLLIFESYKACTVSQEVWTKADATWSRKGLACETRRNTGELTNLNAPSLIEPSQGRKSRRLGHMH